MKDDHYWLTKAYKHAAKFSTDLSTQIGMVLLSPDGDFLASASNHFPLGVIETAERLQRPTKYSYVVHAERNLIYWCAKRGIPTENCTLYATWFACAECAQAIVQAGIKTVIGHDSPHQKTRDDWYEQCRIGDIILTEGGVNFKRIPGTFPGIKIRFNGKLVEP